MKINYDGRVMTVQQAYDEGTYQSRGALLNQLGHAVYIDGSDAGKKLDAFDRARSLFQRYGFVPGGSSERALRHTERRYRRLLKAGLLG